MTIIIIRMGEHLPWRFRGAAEWLAIGKHFAPLGKALTDELGENISPQLFGQWLKRHRGETVEGMKLTGRYSSHRRGWRYHVGNGVGIMPAPVAATPRQLAHLVAAIAPLPVPRVETPRPVARFSSASTNVVQGPSGSIIRNAEPVSRYVPPEPQEEQPAPAAPIPEPQHMTDRDRRPDVLKARALHQAAQAAGANTGNDWKHRGAIRTYPTWNPFTRN